MKKSVIAPLAALACAAVVATFALGGASKFGDVQVHADPVEHSVTFNESNTTVEDLDGNYAIGTTTASGNKVGVVGWHNEDACFTFKGVSFRSLRLCDYEAFAEGDAYPFSTITGFAISFSGKDEGFVYMLFDSMDEEIYNVESGKEYKGLSITPFKNPSFRLMEGSVTVSSLTIWYSC